MARKSSGLDKKLLEVGRRLLIRHGASALSLREVARIADVNLGMFNYHFKNKQNFIRIILDEIYAEFLENFELSSKGDSISKLRSQMISMSTFSRDNRVLALSIITDILRDDKVVKEFVTANFSKHFKILKNTLVECQKEGLIIDAPVPLLLTQIAAGVGLTNMLPELLIKLNSCAQAKSSAEILLTDDVIKLRVDIVLNGIMKR